MKDKTKRLVAAIVAALLTIGGVTIAVDSTDDGHGHKARTITVHVDGVDRDHKADDTVTTTTAAVGKLEDASKGDLTGGLNAGAVPQPLGGPLAAQDFPGCRTQFVRNMSSRYGTRVRIIVLHYTVSRDNGWSSNNALTAMANNPANGVSWTFSIGRKTGTCAYNVPLSMKPWTQANANPFSVGIEVVAYGDEGVYVEGAGRTRLVGVVRELEHRLDIPNQRGLVRNCQAVRPGIVRHVDLGKCGGGHHDTDPFPDPIPGLVAAVGAPVRKPITKRDRAACQRSRAFHDRGRKAHATEGTARQKTRMRRLHAKRLSCRDGKVIRI